MSKKYRFRSGAEKTMAECLTDAAVAFDFEPHYIPYDWTESKKYLPDFVLESSGIILEVKGRFKLEDRKKHLFLRKSNPNIDVRFVFTNSRSKLYKGSKTTYADWCVKNNFLYCDLKDGVPQKWLDA
jgi:hypothetical protein